MICCFQVSNVLCSRYGSANAFSARNPRYLGLHTDVAIFVLREVSFIQCLPDTDTTFPRGSEAVTREELAGASL